MRFTQAISAVAAIAVATSVALFAATSASAQQANRLKRFKDWTTYKYDGSDKRICFAATKPKDSEPKNVNRGDIYLYVSTWPAEAAQNEISVKIGYAFKPGTEVTATIGKNVFTMFTKGDKAFVKDTALEKKMLNAMLKGNKVVIKGRSSRGTVTEDTFSLLGISAAVRHANKACS